MDLDEVSLRKKREPLEYNCVIAVYGSVFLVSSNPVSPDEGTPHLSEYYLANGSDLHGIIDAEKHQLESGIYRCIVKIGCPTTFNGESTEYDMDVYVDPDSFIGQEIVDSSTILSLMGTIDSQTQTANALIKKYRRLHETFEELLVREYAAAELRDMYRIQAGVETKCQ